MASILDPIFNFIRGVFDVLNTPWAVILTLLIVGVGGLVYFLYSKVKPSYRVLYFAEDENLGEEFNVKRRTPTFLYSKKSKDNYRFIRFREAFNFEIGWQTVTRWLAKKGTAFTKRLESGDVGEFTLYKIMCAVWGLEVVEALKDEEKQKLIESQVMITVRLEPGKNPEGIEKDITEIQIKTETDAEMSRQFGENIRRELTKEDWIRTIGLIGSGVALCYIGQAMGLIGGVA